MCACVRVCVLCVCMFEIAMTTQHPPMFITTHTNIPTGVILVEMTLLCDDIILQFIVDTALSFLSQKLVRSIV